MSMYTVSSMAELEAALKRASGGDVIELADGHYGDFSMRGAEYDSEVTVRSADPDNPAVFNTIQITASSNLTFESIFIDFTPTEGTVEWESAFRAVQDVSNITLRNSKIEGGDSIGGVSPDSDPGEQGKHGILGEPIARAITISGANITIENNDISHFASGIIMSGTGNKILDNEIYDLRTTPLRGNGSDLVINGNYFHDSNPWNMGGKGDHGDYVHLWTEPNGQPMENITITNNVFSDENGGDLLGIYLDDNRNDVGYTNVVVEGNVIYSRTEQAVRFENVSDAWIVRNTILNPGDVQQKGTPLVLTGGTENVRLEGNIVSTFFGEDAQQALTDIGFTFENNLEVNYEDPRAENYIGRILTDSRVEGSGLWERAVVPGSVADGLGAALMHLDDQPDRLTPAFEVEKAGEGGADYILRADLSRGPDGAVTASDARFIWDFGDGTGATGQVVRHTYADPGRYDATLTVVMPDGASATANSEIAVMGADTLSFDPQSGLFQAEGYGETEAIENSDRGSVSTGDGYGLDLGGTGVAVAVGQSNISRIFGAESFDMSMTLRADTLGSTGEVARIHGNFLLSIADGGEVSVTLWTDAGSAKLATTRAMVNDGENHDIRIAFNSAASRIEIHVDGELAAAKDIEGAMRGDYPRDLHFGNAWGKENFDGTLTAFDLEVGNQHYPDYAGDASVIPGEAIPIEELLHMEPTHDTVPLPPRSLQLETTEPIEKDAWNDTDPSPTPGSQAFTSASVDVVCHGNGLPHIVSEKSTISASRSPVVLVDYAADRLEVAVDDPAVPSAPGADPDAISWTLSDRYEAVNSASTLYLDNGYADQGDLVDLELFVEDAPIF